MANSDSPSPAFRAAEAQADHVSALLEVTRALLEQKRRVDMAGLDQHIGRLCAAALDLPPEEGRQLRPRLERLAETVAALEQSFPK